MYKRQDLETGEVRGGDDSEVLSLDDLIDDSTMDSLENLAAEESDDERPPFAETLLTNDPNIVGRIPVVDIMGHNGRIIAPGNKPITNPAAVLLGALEPYDVDFLPVGQPPLSPEDFRTLSELYGGAIQEGEYVDKDWDEDDDIFEVDYGEGPHYLDKAEDNIYAIATAAAKGDKDKKEKIVLALKRNHQNLLKAFRFAGEKGSRGRLKYITFKEAEERDRKEIQDFWDRQYREWQESQNPTKPRWGGEGIGQHMEKAKWEKLIRIKSGSDNTKGKILPFESAEDAEKKLPEAEQAKLRSDRLVRRSTRYLSLIHI